MSKHLQTRPLVLSGVLLASVLCCTSAFGQHRLPPALIASSNASDPGERAKIDEFVKNELGAIKAGTDLSTARDALTQQAANKTASPSFLNAYSASIANEIAAQGLDTAQDIRARLNAAIVVAKVANAANNTTFAKLAQTFVADKAESVALWGIKATQSIIPAMLLNGQDSKPLSTAVIEAVKLHAISDVIPEDAYRALTLSDTLTDAKRSTLINSTLLQPYVQVPLALFEYRVSLYTTAAPPAPGADATGASFLVNGKAWGAMSSPQQSQAANLLVALANGAGAQFNAGQPELADLIKRTAQALQVLGTLASDGTISSTSKALASIGNTTPQNTVQTQIKAVEDAVRAKFPSGSTSVARP